MEEKACIEGYKAEDNVREVGGKEGEVSHDRAVDGVTLQQGQIFAEPCAVNQPANKIRVRINYCTIASTF